MNKIQYEQENNMRYMKIEFCNMTQEAEYEIKMLMNNQISIFFANCYKRQLIIKIYIFMMLLPNSSIVKYMNLINCR